MLNLTVLAMVFMSGVIYFLYKYKYISVKKKKQFDLSIFCRTHNNIYAFKCQHCPKKYRNRYMLVGHMYRHLGKVYLLTFYCINDRLLTTKRSVSLLGS